MTAYKHIAFSIALVATSSASSFAQQATTTSSPTTIPYKINIASFSGLFGGADPTRVIQNSASAWSWQGGSSVDFVNTGTTSETGCSLGAPNHVYASSGCDPTDATPCTSLANFSYCYPGFRIRVWAAATNWVLGQSYFPSVDTELQVPITHEFGHYFSASHFSNTIGCIMGVGASSPRSIGFCPQEINAAGTSVGQPRAFAARRISIAGWTEPTAWGGQSGTIISYGLGMGDLARGVRLPGPVATSSLFVARTNIAPHSVEACDFVSGVCPIGSVGDSIRRPTVTFDPTRSRWWVFSHPTSAPEAVVVSTSTDLVSWTSTTLSDLQTRYPVGADYDSISDSIVVVWVNNRAGSRVAPGSRAIEGCDYGVVPGQVNQFGCVRDVNVTLLSASNPPAVRSNYRFKQNSKSGWDFGHGLAGAPYLDCDPGGAYYNCEVSGVGLDPGRNLYEWRFSTTASGTVVGHTNPIVTPGLTDFPIGGSGRRLDGSGAIVQAVQGLDQRLYVRSKTSIQASWSTWNTIDNTKVYFGPLVELATAGSTYDLLYAPR